MYAIFLNINYLYTIIILCIYASLKGGGCSLKYMPAGVMVTSYVYYNIYNNSFIT